MYRQLAIMTAMLLPFLAWASPAVLINEFSPTGDEWIELYNNSDDSVDMSGWRLTELSTPATTPKENTALNLSGTIDAHSYLVVNLTKKLNDDGDSIALYDAPADASTNTQPLCRVTYGDVAPPYVVTRGLEKPIAAGLSASYDATSGSWWIGTSTKGTENWWQNPGILTETTTSTDTAAISTSTATSTPTTTILTNDDNNPTSTTTATSTNPVITVVASSTNQSNKNNLIDIGSKKGGKGEENSRQFLGQLQFVSMPSAPTVLSAETGIEERKRELDRRIDNVADRLRKLLLELVQ
jgi:hypothetical protein